MYRDLKLDNNKNINNSNNSNDGNDSNDNELFVIVFIEITPVRKMYNYM